LLPQAAPARAPVILVVGDSLSAGYGIEMRAGWVSLLQQRLAQSGYAHQVVNASISGDTTGGGRSRLPQALRLHAPDIVIIELGANDGLRGLSLADMRDNLAAMIKTAHAARAKVLLVGMHLPSNYGTVYTRKFHAVYSDLAKKLRVPLAPFVLDGIALKPELLQADGLHPVAAAQPRMLDNVWPHLKPLLAADNHTPRSSGSPAGG
jgi:acyl-CoA thioesterase-1